MAPPKWQLDRHIPVALIMALALQTMAGVWFASALVMRVGVLEEKAGKAEVAIMKQSHDVTLMQAHLEAVTDSNRRIEDKLEKLFVAKPMAVQ